MLKNKKTFFAVIFLFSFACVAYVSQAGTSENGTGWLWGGSDTNFGWVSMNNTSGGGAVSYGVNIPATDGSISGYAWSENVGWIDFSGASRLGDNIVGSATIKSIADAAGIGNSGGWLGRVSLSGVAQDNSPYGVSINPSNNTLSGYAWSDELGWLDFSRASMNVVKTIIGTISASPSIVADSTTPVNVTVEITGGTANSADITYELDCTDDGVFEKTHFSTTGESTHTFLGADACSGYSSSGYITARITRDGASVTLKALITYGCVDSVCNRTTYTCESQIKTPGNCNEHCQISNCSRPPGKNLNWREVNPN